MKEILRLVQEYRQTAKQLGISLQELENIVRLRNPNYLKIIEDAFMIARDLEEDEDLTLRAIFATLEEK